MSLTSYRAAPPRGGLGSLRRDTRCFLSGLAVTYSPTSWDAVPSARRHLTAEFGMGSGVLRVLLPPNRRRNTISWPLGRLLQSVASGPGRPCRYRIGSSLSGD
jgi:hypothetical protein